MITIVIGDVTEYLCHRAQQIDKSAQLLTYDNFIKLDHGTYYTSLGDFPGYRSFADMLEFADVIVYAPPEHWSDQTSAGSSYMKYWTEYCLFYFNDKKTVIGYCPAPVANASQILHLQDARKTNDCQLWVVGGSDSHGMGVAKNERYGQIIADRLNVQVTFLTKPKSSIEWAADQILRSDVCAGDTIVWGLVPSARFPFYTGDTVVHVSCGHFEDFPEFIKNVGVEQLLNPNTLLYRPIVSIAKVQNFCNKIGVNLIIAGLHTRSEYSEFLTTFKNYIHLADRFGFNHEDMFLDIGSDNTHAGPLTHQWYATQILTRMSALGINLVAS